MWSRKPRAEYEAGKGEVNRAAMYDLIHSGHVPGVIAYLDDAPVGWCSFGRREEFLRLNNSRTLKPVDERPVWSIVCLFVHRKHRRKGLSVALLQAARDWATKQGATVIEGYPVVPRKREVPDMTAWHGTARAYERAGFCEVARPTEARAIYRYEVAA